MKDKRAKPAIFYWIIKLEDLKIRRLGKREERTKSKEERSIPEVSLQVSCLMSHVFFLLSFVLCFISIFSSHAQTNPHAIKVLAKVKKEGVLLRWAPTDFTVWQLGNKYGYKVERYLLKPDGNLESPLALKLNSQAIKPLSERELETLAQKTEEVGVIQELIYGKDPDDNQGKEDSRASILRKQGDLNNRFGMALMVCDLSPQIAQAAGLFFKDTAAAQGAKYIYKISLSDNPAKLKTEPGVIVVDVIEAKALQPFKDLQALFGDKTVTMSWPLLTHRGIYSAYHIEKSTDGKLFKSVLDLPYVPMSESSNAEEAHFVDSLENNATQYYYRVKGITPFGEEGPPSNTVQGMGKDNLSGHIVLREAKLAEKNKVSIKWEFPAEEESKIGGFVISKSSKSDGPWKDVNTKEIQAKNREFLDASPLTSTYYRIRAVDLQGKEVSHSQPYFVHVEDNVPPSIPTEPTGKIDSKGIVTLTWKANNEPDLIGYRVFSSNDSKEEFVEVTRQIITTPAYTDTVNTHVLNKKIFYKIVAVDHNYNASGYSKHLMLFKPDLIAPAPPVFSKVEAKEKAIILEWINSPSKEVAKYILYRAEKSDTAKTSILSWKANKPKNNHTDAILLPGKTYQYHLHAYDSTGNFSAASSKEIRFETGIRKSVSEVTALIDREKKTILIKWQYDEPIKKWLLYRRKNEEQFSLYQTISGSAKEFSDNQVVINNTYSYKLQLVTNTNAKTELSKELKVKF